MPIRIVHLQPRHLLTDLSDVHALIAEEQSVIALLNDERLGTMKLYARAVDGDERDWRCSGCDRDRIDLQTGAVTLRLNFPQRITSLAALRKTLQRSADRARAALEKLDSRQTEPKE